MIVVVCGSRDWADGEAIASRLLDVTIEAAGRGDTGRHTLIHGAAPGADRLAGKIGWGLAFTVEPHPADWGHHGRAAGPIRNRQMLDRCPDLVLAFQRNGSRGTQDCVDEARRRGIAVEVHEA